MDTDERSWIYRLDKGKCLGTELNRRRRPFQGRALPTELPRLANLIKLTEERRTRKDRNSKCSGGLQSSLGNAYTARFSIDFPLLPMIGAIAAGIHLRGECFGLDVVGHPRHRFGQAIG